MIIDTDKLVQNCKCVDGIGCCYAYLLIEGEKITRITGVESGFEKCPDCGCNNVKNENHHSGCDREECPKCGCQLLGCGCQVWSLLK